MVHSTTEHLPIAIIGAGPIGLAAASHLVERKLPFMVLEAADQVGASIREWGHVPLFSPWRYLLDRSAERLLGESGWQKPDETAIPTGGAFLDAYLGPLANLPALKPNISYGAKVMAIGRRGFDKVKSQGRERQPFEILLENGARLLASAVLDASGTWYQPNPIGSGGVAAIGEQAARDHIAYGIPDILGAERARYQGKRVLVVGSGHSAMNNLLQLLNPGAEGTQSSVIWALRREAMDQVYGGGEADALPARGALGAKVKTAVNEGRMQVVTPFRIYEISKTADGLRVTGDQAGRERSVLVDEIIAATGFRPNLSMLREIRVDLDPWLEAPKTLAPLIDPNLHSCGTVRPHGAVELSHPEADFYILGMKSYGRAPTFLMATGYEQARSVAALLAGDKEAAMRVELDLPETGVCSASPDVSDTGAGGACCAPPAKSAAAGAQPVITPDKPRKKEEKTMTIEAKDQENSSGCCGGPAPQDVDACCVKDADAKASGEAGCGCGSEPKDAKPQPETAGSCC